MDNRKLGRQPARHDPRTLKLASYLDVKTLPAIPGTQEWGGPVSQWGMMKNDTLGDCTIAAAGHLILMDTTYQKKPFTPSDDQIVSAYSAITGYDPSDPSTDQGAVELDVLKYWRKSGIANHKIVAFVSVPATNLALVRAAIYLFGAVYSGVNLPVSAQDQEVWDVNGPGDNSPGSWGGHAVPLVGYGDDEMTCVTWGALKNLTTAWWLAYGEEAYAIVSADWAPPDACAPNSFNLTQLKADLADVTK